MAEVFEGGVQHRWDHQWPIGLLYLGCPEPCFTCCSPCVGHCAACKYPVCAACLHLRHPCTTGTTANPPQDAADYADSEYEEKTTQPNISCDVEPESITEMMVPRTATPHSSENYDECDQNTYRNILGAWHISQKSAVTKIDKTNFINIKHLSSLTKCFLPSEDEEGWRQWGTSQHEWKKLLRTLDWDITGLILINLTRQKCAVYDPGKPVYFEQLGSCLSWLASHKDVLGVLQRGKEGSYEYALMNVTQNLYEEIPRARCQQLYRLADRITKVVITRWDDVRFYKQYVH